ncbi:MAG TPA: hypothetical protein VGJ79_08115 [Candidatus Dormibacteraeota bacterium]
MSSTMMARIFVGLWFGFSAFWTLAASMAVLTGRASGSTPGFVGPLLGFGLAALGVLFNVVGRGLAYGDPAFLRAFLEEELQLQEPPMGAIPAA